MFHAIFIYSSSFSRRILLFTFYSGERKKSFFPNCISIQYLINFHIFYTLHKKSRGKSQFNLWKSGVEPEFGKKMVS